MKVVVGSTNPVKVAAAQAIFARLAADVSVEGSAVDSGVPIQPWGDEQTRQGALNRAHAALSNEVDYGVGFEGGLIETEMGIMTCAWCAVVNREGRVGMGGGVNILLPPAVTEAVQAGKELGPAMDALIGEADTKQGPGAVGILTDGLVDRQAAYEHILILALGPFRRPDLYTKTSNEA
jgi:inosine/xanthosine triphosphatase